MSLSSTTNRVSYTGNGTTATYSYTFKIYAQTDLKVIVKNTSTGAETVLTISTDYTVTGVSDTSGGTIVLVDDSQAWIDGSGYLDTGYTLTIRRVRPLTQTADIRNQGDFYAEVHEDVFDKLTMVDQQQQDEIDRSVKLPDTILSSTFDPTLPADIGTANAALVVNSSGDGFDMGPTTTQISSAESNATAAAASATLAENWATKVDGQVASTDYSSKAWALGGTGVTDTASAGASKEWATKTSGTVDTSEYSAKEYAQGTQAGTGGSAKDWAIETASDVDSVDYSSKEYAIGTQTRGAAGGGSAKDWAQYTGGTVDDSEYSAKYYSQEAATSAASAAAALNSAFFRDVVYITNADSPVTISQSDNGKLYSMDSSGGAIAITLPEIATLSLPFNIAFALGTAGNDITISRSATDTIGGATSYVLSAVGTGAQFAADTDGTPDDWTYLEFGTVADGAITRAKLASGAVAAVNYSAKTSAYTATNADDVLTADATSAAFTITLYTASGNSGRKLTIKKIDSSVNVVTIDGNASETIDGAAAIYLRDQYSSVELMSDGTNWIIVNDSRLNYAAAVTKSSALSVANNTWTSITFNNTKLNRANMVSDGGGNGTLITIPEDGVYLIKAGTNYGGNSSGSRRVRVQLDPAGSPSTLQTSYSGDPNSAGSSTTVETSLIVDLNAGDVLNCQTYQNSGGSLSLDLAGTSTYFSAQKL